MKPLALALLSSTLLLGVSHVHACSCSGQGPISALTTRDQTYGVRLSERLVLGNGAFDAHARYQAFSREEHDRTLSYVLVGAYRIGRFELAGGFEYGSRFAQIAAESGHSTGFGDTIARLRFEALDESEPWQPGMVPALALLASARLPTGSATGLTQLGNGATELATGATLERTFAHWFRVGVLGDVALRLSDNALGYARRLGPRASGELTLSYFATREVVLSVLGNVRWEGNVAVRGQAQSGTAQRTTELGAAVAWQPASRPFRAGITQRYAPPLDAWGANTIQNATTELWLGFTR